jgi:hypothetical protein
MEISTITTYCISIIINMSVVPYYQCCASVVNTVSVPWLRITDTRTSKAFINVRKLTISVILSVVPPSTVKVTFTKSF